MVAAVAVDIRTRCPVHRSRSHGHGSRVFSSPTTAFGPTTSDKEAWAIAGSSPHSLSSLNATILLPAWCVSHADADGAD